MKNGTPDADLPSMATSKLLTEMFRLLDQRVMDYKDEGTNRLVREKRELVKQSISGILATCPREFRLQDLSETQIAELRKQTMYPTNALLAVRLILSSQPDIAQDDDDLPATLTLDELRQLSVRDRDTNRSSGADRPRT